VPLADTTVHEIHTSERRSYRACRRRWDWIFNQNYYPVMTAKPLDFGVAYHKGMETFYKPETWDFPPNIKTELAIKAFVDTTNKQRKKYMEVVEDWKLEEDVQTDFDERVELGKGMIRYHAERVSPAEDGHWKPVRVEIAFQIPIVHPDNGQPLTCVNPHCRHPQGAPVVYAGRMDALGEDAHGDYWVIDWKTARSLTANDEFLQLDDQVGSYVWACNILGLPVRGFIYHEMKKGFPQPPPKNKVQRLGCWFSKNKQQDTNYEIYRDTVMKEDSKAFEEGLYDDMLYFLQEEGPRYYQRFQINKSPAELEQIGRNIGLEALEMIDPGTRIYPSPGRFGCSFCAFRQPCLGQNNGEDYTYALDTLFERREHYYVREDASTESKGAE